MKILEGNNYPLVILLLGMKLVGCKLKFFPFSYFTLACRRILNCRQNDDNNRNDDDDGETICCHDFLCVIFVLYRYQLVAGVVEQRILEPIFYKQKLVLSALCFAVRTGNTYLGSLLYISFSLLIRA